MSFLDDLNAGNPVDTSMAEAPSGMIRRSEVMQPMRIYVCGLLTAATVSEREQNIKVADDMGRALFLLGHVPFVPHTHSHTWFDHVDDYPEFQDYKRLVVDYDINGWLAVCDAIFCLEGWERSKGGVMEYKAAQEMNRIFYYRNDQVPIVHGLGNDDFRYV